MIPFGTKFAIGLNTLENYKSIDEFDSFCKEYRDSIAFFYTQPIDVFSSIPGKTGYKINVSKSYEQLGTLVEVIRRYGLGIQLCYNNPYKLMPSKHYVNSLFAFQQKFGNVCSLVVSDSMAGLFGKYVPEMPLTYSYTNCIDRIRLKNLSHCNMIVLADKHIRSISYFNRLKDFYGVGIELLLNCGCHILCNKRCIPCICYKNQSRLIKERGLEWCLAQQTLLPSELDLYPNGNVDLFKLSTRIKNFSLEKVAYLIDAYSKHLSYKDLHISFDKEGDWSFFSGIKYLNDEVDANISNIDLDKVIDIKSHIWSNILGFDVKVR